MDVRILTLFDEEPFLAKPESAPRSKALSQKIKEEPKETEATSRPDPIVQKQTNRDSTEKNYYSIGETAQKFKVRTSHIRFWTIQFDLKVRTTRKGDRLYTPENIEELRAIHHLVKEQGHTIAGAKVKLKEQKKNQNKELPQKGNIIEKLQEIRATLISLRAKI